MNNQTLLTFNCLLLFTYCCCDATATVQSSTALFNADQLYVHVCVAPKEIMHLASGRLGIHGYCKVSKETVPRILTMPAFLGLLQMETDI